MSQTSYSQTQDFPIVVAVSSAELYEETLLAIAATGRTFLRSVGVDPSSAQWRRAAAIVVDRENLAILQQHPDPLPCGPIICVELDHEASAKHDSLVYALPSMAVELVMALGRSGPIRVADAGADTVPVDVDETADTGFGGDVSGSMAHGRRGSFGSMVLVVPAVGGAGASVASVLLARSLAQASRHRQRSRRRGALSEGGSGGVANRGQPVCLIDADEFSGGIDLLLGAEGTLGVGWSDIRAEHGTLDAEALMEALPSVPIAAGELRFLSGARHRGEQWKVNSQSVSVVADSLLRAGVGVVVDMPRDLALIGSLAPQADAVILVVPLSVRGIAAAGRLSSALLDAGIEAVAITRAQRNPDVASADVEASTGLTVWAEIPYAKGLSHEINVRGVSTSSAKLLKALHPVAKELAR